MLYSICVVVSLELFASVNAQLQMICRESADHDVCNNWINNNTVRLRIHPSLFVTVFNSVIFNTVCSWIVVSYYVNVAQFLNGNIQRLRWLPSDFTGTWNLRLNRLKIHRNKMGEKICGQSLSYSRNAAKLTNKHTNRLVSLHTYIVMWYRGKEIDKIDLQWRGKNLTCAGGHNSESNVVGSMHVWPLDLEIYTMTNKHTKRWNLLCCDSMVIHSTKFRRRVILGRGTASTCTWCDADRKHVRQFCVRDTAGYGRGSRISYLL